LSVPNGFTSWSPTWSPTCSTWGVGSASNPTKLFTAPRFTSRPRWPRKTATTRGASCPRLPAGRAPSRVPLLVPTGTTTHKGGTMDPNTALAAARKAAQEILSGDVSDAVIELVRAVAALDAHL